MALILRHQRTQQPQQPVPVDRQNPFGRRAISAWLPATAAGFDVARGRDNPDTNPAGYVVGEHGVALAYPGGSLDAAPQRPRLLTQSLPSTTDITIVLAARYYGDGARVFACSTIEAIPTSATAFDIYVSGVKRFTATFTGGCRKCLVVAYRTNTPTVDPVVFADGVQATITKSGTASSVSVSGNFAIGNHHSLTRQLHADIYGAALLGMVVSPAEAKSLSDNPWQLFAPQTRRIWVPVASGGGTMYSITGAGNIASAETIGTAAASFHTSAAPTGIASAEAFGSATATRTSLASVTATGIASGEAFGSASAARIAAAQVATTGIGSAEAFGTASAVWRSAIVAPGIASAEAFGSASVERTGEAFIAPDGITSAEAFGTAVLSRFGVEQIVTVGIASGEAFGVASFSRDGVTPPSGGFWRRLSVGLGIGI